MLTAHLPRTPIAHLPTPLEALPRLSERLGGPEIWIKRDDQTGLAGGGNKTRKLEYLVAAAQQAGARTLVTGGAPQSNHCRQTAAAAARAGLRAVLVLGGHAPNAATGNILLDRLLGAEIVWTGDAARDDVMAATVEREKSAGHQPYLIPYGGSNPIGASGYVAAVEELAGQLEPAGVSGFDYMVFASSSGGTHAGLALGARALDFQTSVLGISVDEPHAVLTERVARLATQTAELLNLEYSFAADDIRANADYLGEGYSIMGAPEMEAIRLFSECEGILLDPVYTGRAAAGMIGLIREGAFSSGERIIFWHTGGAAALFAPQYSERLADFNLAS